MSGQAQATIPTHHRSIQEKIETGQVKAALAEALQWLEIDPLDRQVLDQAATCYRTLGDGKTALSLLRVISQHWPDDPQAWGRAGAMALLLGDREGAAHAYEQAVKLKPRSAHALAALNRLAPFQRDGRRARLLRQITRNAGYPSGERAVAWNALGRIEDRAERPRAALHCFSRAKSLSPGQYHPGAMEALLEAQKALYHAPKPASGGARLIFVVGLPRSGTTLTESILACHPQVQSIGESYALQESLAAARHLAGDAWGWQGLDEAQWKALRQHFLERAELLSDAPVIVSKMPMDCLNIGYAAHLWPEARFVVMDRHPLDTGLSNFTTHFHDTHGFSKRFDWIGHLTRIVEEATQDYREKLGERVRIQSYRALVQDPPAAIAALLDHTRLDWCDACLTPERRPGGIRTASLIQVREGINQSGLGTWKAYNGLLDPLVAALGGDAYLDAWAARDAAREE
ncbi:sulfotransferase [Thalassococcus sp. S3]|uniref:tetratricopeptide repeat-containing sulfotransferase family protein n=1 Tax=Thalassococcus sp. S3 TaxID=2017482 RepID=UPI001023FC18|nr:sulfotransferase [Thalassococcus sp. S3]QBF34234.1 hypothetical protein CFI11_23910 [Thalassococcus sp. S3]